MNTIYDGELSSRDYVVHIFTGVLFNVFLFLALRPSLSPWIFTLDIPSELILTLVAIPVMFLEGHFLLAFDRFIFVEFPSWMFGLKNRRNADGKNTNVTIENQSEGDDQVSAPYREFRENLFKHRCKLPFYLLFGKRIIGQKIIRKSKDETLVKTNIENNKALSKRYYVLTDFFKGVGCGAWVAFIVACAKQNWQAVAVLGGVIILAWLRCRFYSRLYVKYRYAKKKKKQKK